MIVYTHIAFKNGDPRVLATPFDSDGNKCGVDDGFKDFKFIYFATPIPGKLSHTTCLAKCP